MRTGLLLPVIVFFGIALFGSSALADDSAGPTRPDILLIVYDDMNPDYLYEYPGKKTRMLDKLVSRGTVFRSAIMQPRCKISRFAMMSGMWPRETNLFFGRDATKNGIADPDVSLSFAVDLLNAGYRTFIAGKLFHNTAGTDTDFHLAGFEAGFVDDEKFARVTQQPLFDWLDTVPEEDNFFLSWSPKLPHGPFLPPQKYLDLIDPTEIEIPAHVQGQPWENEWVYGQQGTWVQLAMMAWADRELKRLVQKLAQLNRLNNLLVVFVVDNGMSVENTGKGSPYDHGWRVPVIVAGAGLPRNASNDALVSITDIRPTILDYAGVPYTEISDGRSLKPLVEGSTPPDWRTRIVHPTWPGVVLTPSWQDELMGLTIHDQQSGFMYLSWLREVRAEYDDWLRIFDGLSGYPTWNCGDEQLFDLDADPFEQVDLADDPAYRDTLRDYRRDANDWLEANGRFGCPE